MNRSSSAEAGGPVSAGRLFDGQAIALVGIILLTEAAIAILFFSLVQQYPAYLLRVSAPFAGARRHLLRSGVVYAGYALSAYGVAKLPAQPLSGWLADRIGARRVLLAGITFCLVVVALMARVKDLPLFVVTCGAYGLAAAVVWPSVYALVGDSYHASRRGRITAAISGAQVTGSACGFAGGALLIDHAGFPPAFTLAFGLNALAFVLGLWRTRAVERPASVRAAHSGHAVGVSRTLAGLGEILSADLLLLSAILVLVSFSVSILAPDLKPYSAAVLHIRYSTLALLLGIPACVAVVTLIPSGVIADRLGRSLPMLTAAALWSLSMLAITVSHGVGLALLFTTIAAFAYALGLPAWSASLIDLSTAGRRGLQVGFASAVQGAGLALGPAIGGQVASQFGILAPFRLSAIFMLVVLALSVAYRARARRLYAAPGPSAAVSS